MHNRADIANLHRALRARAGPLDFLPNPSGSQTSDPSTPPDPASGGDKGDNGTGNGGQGNGNGGNNGGNNNGGGQNQNKPSSASPSSAQPSKTPTTPSKSQDGDDKDKDNDTKPTGQSDANSASESKSTDASAASVSPSLTVSVPNTSKSAPTAGGVKTPVAGKQALDTAVESFNNAVPSASDAPTNSPATVGAINVGAVIGGVAGGIAAVALLFFVCMFFIRRRRQNSEEFDPVNFRNSAHMGNDTADPFNARARPPTMIERHLGGHHAAPSMASMQGANMAGAGAANMAGAGTYGDEGYAGQGYDQGYSQHQQTQASQQYNYGQSYGHGAYGPEDGEYNGAYSTEPQVQDIYAAEAYAYPNDVVVSPGMQSQEMGHYQQQHRQQQSQSNDAYGGI